ncbi:MAG: hypothetical protein WAT25_11080 [Paracoccaceae bacterium]
MRPRHDQTPPHCIEATALALRKAIPREDLDLAHLPAFALDF